MSDRQVVALAVAVAVGSVVAHHAPVLPVAAAAIGAWARRRPWLLIVAAAVLASALGARALDGLRPPPPTPLRGSWATLLTDPATVTGGAVGVELRIGHRHVSAYARGGAATTLAPRLAGERVRVDGALAPLSPVQRARLLPRHIAAQLTIDRVTGVAPANLVGRAANDFRRVVFGGATALPEGLRPLFGGMVLGDDRGQSVELADAFRASGLTHLLVVSGENVAFALLVAAPLIRRGRLWWRLAATLAVLFAFGTLTRWEPSVVRAEAMAAIAAVGAFAGRPIAATRLLALSVTGCLLVDPLLVHSVGFRLSVAACVGLVVLTPPLRRRGVPLLLAASIGAQLGAAVVLVPTFGTVPLVSLPANVLAVPVAGPLMMWGMTAGTLAGLVTPLAPVLHAPTHLALAWEAAVAQRSAALPVAPVAGAGSLILGVAVVALVLDRRCVAVASVAILAVVGLALRGPAPTTAATIAPGVTLWVVGGRSVLAIGARVPPRVLDDLRARRLHRLDVLVETRPGRASADAVAPLVHAFHPRVVLAPEHHQIAGAYTARLGAEVDVGGAAVRVVDAGPPLRVRVTPRVYARPVSSGRLATLAFPPTRPVSSGRLATLAFPWP
ncbi:MAG TPA: ComEC/Rec2 family competence protein [Acidimicrobiales bacterium]|nr:ComEC/Rec2 family competence protein [Acidimicrobiales bacterium]